MAGGRRLGVAVVLAIVNTAGSLAVSARVRPSPAAPLRLALPLASPVMARTELARSFAISSDGTRVVMRSRQRGSSLYVQDLVSGEIKPLAETAGADAPAFSPDGRAIAFKSGSTIKVLPS